MQADLATSIDRHDKGGLSTSKSVLMYSHDSYCLGHLRRNTNIASRLTREMPDFTALLLADCASSGVFDMPKGVDLIKLPSVDKTGADAWAPKGLRVSQQMTKDLRAQLIKSAARAFKPDCF